MHNLSKAQNESPVGRQLSSSVFFELVIAAKHLTTVVPLVQTFFSSVWTVFEKDKVEPFDDDEQTVHTYLKNLFREKIANTSPGYWELDDTKKPIWCMTFSALRATCNEYIKNIPDNCKTMHNVAINQLEALVGLVSLWARERPGGNRS